MQNGERPVFDGKNNMNDAVLASGNNFVISGFEIRDYKGNGVVINKAKNATFKNLVCQNTGKYGVYPVLCQGVLVEAASSATCGTPGSTPGSARTWSFRTASRTATRSAWRPKLRQRADGQQLGPSEFAGSAGGAAAGSAHDHGLERAA